MVSNEQSKELPERFIVPPSTCMMKPFPRPTRSSKPRRVVRSRAEQPKILLHP